jgi:PAS domain S-box-containing protein
MNHEPTTNNQDSMKKFWSKLPASYRGAIVISIPTICLLMTLGAWAWSWQRETDLNKQIDRTQQIIDRSNELLITLLNAETGVRGFNLSRNESFLEPYQKARVDLPNALQNLNQLVENQSQQQQRTREIERLSWRDLNILENRIELTKSQGKQAVQLPQFDKSLYLGKATMDEIRQEIGSLQQQEQLLLNLQRQKLNEIRRITSTIQWCTAVISALAYLAALYLFKDLERDLNKSNINLNKSKTLIQAIDTNVIDGIVTLNKKGEIETFNPTAAIMFGYEPEEIIGKPLTKLLADIPDSKSLKSNIEIENGHRYKLAHPQQKLGIGKVGAPFSVEISISELNLDDRSLVIIRDITERQQAEKKLQARASELARLSKVLAETNEELQERNQELEQFAYVTSHDLRAPLRAIANLSEWIEEDLEGQLSPENQKQMQLLRARVSRLEGLINGLLEYSRAGRTQVLTELVDVGQLIAEVIDSLAPPPTFKIEVGANMPAIDTKRILLFQVFSNLIGNAIKYHSRLDGHILISVRDKGEYYEFSVADDGQGIAPEHHEKVFQIFQTLQSRDQTESTGIGLAIVKKIIEAEGGKITLESQLGKGATFRFTWGK